MSGSLIEFIRDEFRSIGSIPLHAPLLSERDKRYVIEAIDSTYVSSVGEFVTRFEKSVAEFTGSPDAVATVNGTAALHAALRMAGVRQGDLVITQPLTFVATCNAISYCGANPVFIDIDEATLGLSATAMRDWLEEHAVMDDTGQCRQKDGAVIRACVPMHTFGHPADLDGLSALCKAWGIQLVEDAAESLGSLYQGRHTGTIGEFGALSFNGNKIITTGGGGMILCSSHRAAAAARHVVTTAKIPHAYEFVHDDIGFNYRMPNLNAALGFSQMKILSHILSAKRALASRYESFLSGSPFRFVKEPKGSQSNYWLNAVICESRQDRDNLLKTTNDAGIMTRPAWTLMPRLPMYSQCLRGPLDSAEWLAERLVNLPSSARLEDIA